MAESRTRLSGDDLDPSRGLAVGEGALFDRKPEMGFVQARFDQ
jgi:hypothetical protein